MTQAFNQAPRSDGLLEGQGNSLLDNPVPAAPSLLESQALRPLAGPHHGHPVQQDGTALARSTCRSRSPWAPWSMQGW